MADKPTALVPIAAMSKEIQAAVKRLPPKVQEVYGQLHGKIGQGAWGLIMIRYDIGVRIAEMLAHPEEYEIADTSSTVKDFAFALGIPGGETGAYNLRNFATTFERAFVSEWSKKPTSTGSFLELHHWMVLMKVEERRDQEKLLKRVLAESLSASSLEEEVRAGAAKTRHARQGGRKPGIPTSPLGGLGRLYKLSNTFNNFAPIAEENVLDAIDEIASDKVDKNLLDQITKAKEAVEAARKNADAVFKHLEKTEGRVSRILDKKYEAAEAAHEAEEKEAAAAPRRGRHESNGHGKPRTAKRKPKRKKAAAA